MSWWRKIPHPLYGNCCGRNLDCSGDGSPVDHQDCACMEHDMNLYSADQMDKPEDVQIERQEADKIFAKRLREDLRPFAYWLWGPIYNRLARIIFR